MKWVGLTGGIGSGKSTVGNLLKSKGFPVESADVLAHLALSPKGSAYQLVVDHFGTEILNKDGSIDRKKLGALVFDQPQKLRELEGFVHPEVRRLASQFKEASRAAGHSVAFYDVPLLFEKNMESLFDEIILVHCSEEQQIERVMTRNGLSRDQVVQRLKQQIPLNEKQQKSDIVFDNSKSEDELHAQVVSYLESLS